MSERKRETRRKVDHIDVGILFGMLYCCRFLPTRSSIGVKMSIYTQILRAEFVLQMC